ncbi:hypothetical protein KP509_29G066500 [Ceratopteris richardii]|uniref:Uncharacterized protein n=1 Tax=Ceratopteris richardii TaxID=49495 RepID=A0A8T2R7R9_CERRI|nr:hypothetical protein KP509_29G066500 [Ceratopteris richardii]
MANCNESCNNRYGVLDIPWRVYCKKACSSDGETWDECRADCNDMCHKTPVIKEYEWSAHLARSPGSPTKARKCEKACIRGCAFKFNVSASELSAAIPRKPETPPPPPPTRPKHAVAESMDRGEPPNISA